ncbi:GtrA family protein [Candidatus Dojkabacteria bacterium]|uniref:GtrA family protein n=1 Tax=Candidatus Dojkabacteria bacterium TaxID=2099670 RepID=A0A955I268_9BACT|nr:GtrA family protein [Candidatus Dojkabacteria bacterium]
MKKYILKDNLKKSSELVKYFAISVVSYILVFILMYVMVDLLDQGTTFSFALTYGIAYVFVFISQLKFIFNQRYSHQALLKFIAHISVFYLLNNITFNFFTEVIKLPYMLALSANVALLFPLRFLSSKLLVFKTGAKKDTNQAEKDDLSSLSEE